MAGIEHLVPTNQLKTTLLDRIAKGEMQRVEYYIYDPDFDAFIFLVVPPDTEKVVHYVDENVALVYRAEDYEVIGVQVEAFEHSFMPKHQNVEHVWRLSDTGLRLNNAGDFLIGFKRQQIGRQLSEQILKASEDVLGDPGKELTDILELA